MEFKKLGVPGEQVKMEPKPEVKQDSKYPPTLSIGKQEVGSQLTGKFRGVREINNAYGRTKIYDFIGDRNNVFSIYGFAALDRLMANAEVSRTYRITYNGKGKKQTPKGVVPYYDITVEVGQ